MRPVAAQIEIAILLELRVKRNAINNIVQCQQRLRRGYLRIVWDATNLSVTGPGRGVLDKNQPVAPWFVCHRDWKLDLQIWKDPQRSIGRRWSGRSDNVRVGPQDALVQPVRR